VAVAVGGLAATVATDMASAINADLDATFIASAAGAVVTITARHKGELGNDYQLNTSFYPSDILPAGITVAYSQTVTGAGNPDVSSSILSTQNGYYSDIAFPYTDAANMSLIEAELDDRWEPLPNATSQSSGQNDSHLWNAVRGTESQLNTWATARNNQHVTTLAVEPKVTINSVDYAGLMSPVWVVSAVYCATGSYYAGITPNGALQNIALSCIQPAAMPSRWTWNERNRLITAGFASYEYDSDGMGNGLVLKTATTNRTLTINGAPTDAEQNTETQKLNSYFRWSIRQMLLSKYPRHRLAADGARISTQQDIVTPKLIKAQIIELAGNWADLGYIENYQQFVADIIVERSTVDCDTVNISISPDHVNQLRVFAARIGYIVC
jgi:phage tail sheath gpL-like